jgi:hypothetical protein
MMADPSVKNQKLKPGTIRRIGTFAKPYKWQIVFFLITVVLDAVLVIATPLLLRRLIDKGVIPHDGPLVTRLAIMVGLLAVADSLMSIIGVDLRPAFFSLLARSATVDRILHSGADGSAHFQNQFGCDRRPAGIYGNALGSRKQFRQPCPCVDHNVGPVLANYHRVPGVVTAFSTSNKMGW